MKSIQVDKVGGALTLVELPVPEPADNQIAVKVVYAAVNPVYVNFTRSKANYC
jgi:NADPH:quinone reductase-like Zn-dependent oxidoreductase